MGFPRQEYWSGLPVNTSELLVLLFKSFWTMSYRPLSSQQYSHLQTRKLVQWMRGGQKFTDQLMVKPEQDFRSLLCAFPCWSACCQPASGCSSLVEDPGGRGGVAASMDTNGKNVRVHHQGSWGAFRIFSTGSRPRTWSSPHSCSQEQGFISFLYQWFPSTLNKGT